MTENSQECYEKRPKNQFLYISVMNQSDTVPSKSVEAARPINLCLLYMENICVKDGCEI